MVRQATTTDREQLAYIWKIAFDDSDPYIYNFLCRYPDYTCLVYEVDKTVAAMLFLIPCSLTNKSGYYVYACATLPEYRGKGYMASLLEHAYKKAQSEDAFGLILIPGNDALFHYYERLHFKHFSELSEMVFRPKEEQEGHLQLHSATDAVVIADIRERFYPADTCVGFGVPHISYITKEVSRGNGAALSVRQNGLNGYALCIQDPDSRRVTVMEWALLSENQQEEDTERFFAGVCRYFKTDGIEVRSKTGTYSGANRPFSMIRKCSGFVAPPAMSAYFNLGMDL